MQCKTNKHHHHHKIQYIEEESPSIQADELAAIAAVLLVTSVVLHMRYSLQRG